MIAIDVNPASFPTGTYSWSSCGAASFVLQRKAGPKDHPLSFSSSPSENFPFMNFCAETRSFWYMSLSCRWFCSTVWGDSHSRSVTWWREGNKGGFGPRGRTGISQLVCEKRWMQWRATDDWKNVWRTQQWRSQRALPNINSTGLWDEGAAWGEWGWREPNFCWCWGGGDTTHRSSLPLVPPALCSVIQITQNWICEVMWVTPHRQNRAVGHDLGQDCHLSPHSGLAEGKNNGSVQINWSHPLCWSIWIRSPLIPERLSLLCHPRWAENCKGRNPETETQISLRDPAKP